MNKPEKKNLLIELAKRKAEAQAAGSAAGHFGQKFSGKVSRAFKPESYTWRGGRNGNGKP